MYCEYGGPFEEQKASIGSLVRFKFAMSINYVARVARHASGTTRALKLLGAFVPLELVCSASEIVLCPSKFTIHLNLELLQDTRPVRLVFLIEETWCCVDDVDLL
jgi:hypothetical protein